jgi:hypothetical protein
MSKLLDANGVVKWTTNKKKTRRWNGQNRWQWWNYKLAERWVGERWRRSWKESFCKDKKKKRGRRNSIPTPVNTTASVDYCIHFRRNTLYTRTIFKKWKGIGCYCNHEKREEREKNINRVLVIYTIFGGRAGTKLFSIKYKNTWGKTSHLGFKDKPFNGV